ncbi:MAG: 1-deoxy-D-xylulose-5-phosphate synthase [Clostridia bacterium]|nr:1-deoxy-D-xylulose-5-phosphate synthase [Clostridia bacterium]
MLEQINNRADLRNLNIREKNILAQEIREYILDVVSKNGGHLASNLGIVELTLAIHNVFDLKKDKVVWDVGHQSYVHKILTGRKEQLKTLRKLDGLAGFPKTSESETDCFNTGHSSTSISAAMGMAKARDLKKENHSVIAVIGDGALTGGMALEALNHVGSSRTNMIVILNDNEMSISKNIGGINKLLTRLRAKRRYTVSNQKGRKIIEKIPVIGRLTVKAVKRIKKSIKQLIIPKMYFEEIGFKYLGPVDGHNIEDLEYILSRAKELDEPVLIHVLTKKGKGYKPAEDNPDKFHGTGPFNIETGESTKKKSKDYSKAFGEKLIELAEKNDRIVAITAAMRDGTGLKDFSTKYPERFFDVGIAEQHALTFAAGLAKEGMIPFVPIYSSFYQRAYDQVIHDICIQKLPVIMCVDRAGCVGNDGETHQGLYDMSFFKLIPNITIMAPKDFEELTKMMEFAIELKAPVVIRYPRGGEADAKFDKHEDIKRGQAEVLQEGKDVTIIGIGKMTATAIRVANEMQKYGLSAEVINARFLKPLDESKITESISNTKFVITIEDGTEIGGLGSSIKELIINKQLEDVKIKCFAYPDEFIKHGSVSELEELYGLDYKNIVNYIKQNIQVTA